MDWLFFSENSDNDDVSTGAMMSNLGARIIHLGAWFGSIQSIGVVFVVNESASSTPVVVNAIGFLPTPPPVGLVSW